MMMFSSLLSVKHGERNHLFSLPDEMISGFGGRLLKSYAIYSLDENKYINTKIPTSPSMF